MSAQLPTTLSQRELDRLGEEPGMEYIRNRVVEKPTSIEACHIEMQILMLLSQEARTTRGFTVFPGSLGYRCFSRDPNQFLKADLSVVRTERLKGIDPRLTFSPIAADLVVEVLCPRDFAEDVMEKIEDYLQNDFKIVWVVSLRTRTVTLFRADGTIVYLHEKDEITGEAALPTFRCKVVEFFARSA